MSDPGYKVGILHPAAVLVQLYVSNEIRTDYVILGNYFPVIPLRMGSRRIEHLYILPKTSERCYIMSVSFVLVH